jgi:hypothetical protein
MLTRSALKMDASTREAAVLREQVLYASAFRNFLAHAIRMPSLRECRNGVRDITALLGMRFLHHISL